MIFNEDMGIEINTDKVKIFHRDAVRAVILKENMLLMIYTNRGDYKFPGGGIEKGESHQEALIREVQEETGYQVEDVKEKMGVIVERRPDILERETLFEMTSNYYICDVSGTQQEQKLDEYESDLEFEPIWVSINNAIIKNETVLKNQGQLINIWVERELLVLKKLKEYLLVE